MEKEDKEDKVIDIRPVFSFPLLDNIVEKDKAACKDMSKCLVANREKIC